MVKELLDFNAPMNVPNYTGHSPLHISAASTHGTECMEILLSEGSNNVINNFEVLYNNFFDIVIIMLLIS